MGADSIKCRIIEEELGTFWPQWHVVKRLGGGAYGDVFEIYRDHFDIREESALKVIQIGDTTEATETISNETTSIPEALRNEIQIMEVLRGAPNIVTIEDFYYKEEVSGGLLFVRMELLTSFKAILADRKKRQSGFSVKEVMKLGADICTALMYCEKRGIIHRDIKPANLFVDDFGNYKVGDFGVSKRMETVHLVQNMTGIGTISYMAPELFAMRPYNNTVDIYALGLILYQLLNNGKLPFLPSEGPPYSVQDIELANKQRLSGTPLPTLAGIEKEDGVVDDALDAIIRKACAPESKDRYQTAGQFYNALFGWWNKWKENADRGIRPAVMPGRDNQSEDNFGRKKRVPDPGRDKISQPPQDSRPSGSRIPLLMAVMAVIVVAFGIKLALSVGGDHTGGPSGGVVSTGSAGSSTDSKKATNDTEVEIVDFDPSDPYPVPNGVSYQPITDGSSAPDWSVYDALIGEIRTTSDLQRRTALMHEAEDYLMGTAAMVPLFYYNDVYLQKTDVKGVYSVPYGHKYFRSATSPRERLKVSIGYEPESIDPAKVSLTSDGSILVNVFEGLCTYQADGKLILALAESYALSEDGRTYVFTLRDGLKWSNGADLTAEDFEYSWKRAASTEMAADYGYMFDVIARTADGELDVTASEDGKKLTVQLNERCVYFPELTATSVYLPVFREQVEEAEEMGLDYGQWMLEAGAVTNGAYTITPWENRESIVLRRNENYYEADKVFIPEIELVLDKNDSESMSLYNDGVLDLVDNINNDDIPSLEGRDDFHITDELGTYASIFNVNSPLFAGKTVDQAIAMRKAFSILIDRSYIIEKVAGNNQKAATSFIPAGMADGSGGIFKENSAEYSFPVGDGYYPAESGDYAVKAAVALLESAGYQFDDSGKLSAQTPINIKYLTNNGVGNYAVAQSIQRDFAKIGIEMEIDELEWKDFLVARDHDEFDFAHYGYISDFNDPINMLELWTSDSSNNECRLGR